MSSLRLYLSGFCLFWLTACSSPPQRDYTNDEYQLLSRMWMQQADKKRAEEDYPNALALYQRAEKYALKRNDLSAIGLAKLKSAAIHITLNAIDKAEALIAQVEQMNAFEQAGLDNAVLFIRAKLHHHLGENAKALPILEALEESYIAEPERNIYYRMVRWSYQADSVDSAIIEADMLVLDKLIAERKLDNIEIYSFALYNWAKFLSNNNDSRAEAAINKAIGHFSSLELTAKIRDCYQLAVNYYRGIGEQDKVLYFEAKIEVLKKA